MMLVGIGVGIGLSLAMVATRPLVSFLPSRVSATDPVSLAAVVGVLSITGLAPTLVPARRAFRVDLNVAPGYE